MKSVHSRPCPAVRRGGSTRIRQSPSSTPTTARCSRSTTPARIRTRRWPTAGWRAATSNARCTPRGSTCARVRSTRRLRSFRCARTKWSIVDGVINVVLDDAPPNLPPGAHHRARPARRHSEKRCGGRVRRWRVCRRRARCARRVSTARLTVIGDRGAPALRPSPAVEGVPCRRCRRGCLGPAKPTTMTLTRSGCSAGARDPPRRGRGRRPPRRRDRGAAPTASSSPPVRGPGQWPAVGWYRCGSAHAAHLDDALALRAALRPGAVSSWWVAASSAPRVASTATGLGYTGRRCEVALTPLAGPLGEELGAVTAVAQVHRGVEVSTGVPVASCCGRRSRRPASPAPTGSSASNWQTVGNCPRTSYWSGSGRFPTRSGPARIRRRSDRPNGALSTRGGVTEGGATNVGRGGHRRLRGHARADCRRAAPVEHWTDALQHPRSRSPPCSPGGTPAVGDRPDLPYFWSDQYDRGSSSRGMPIPATRSPSRWASLRRRPASWPCTGREGQPVAVLGVDQPKLFTRWRRQLAVVPVPA